MDEISLGLSVLAADANKVVAPQPEAADIGLRLMVLAVLFVAPFIVGAVLARALRLKEFSNRIGTVLLSIALGLAPFGYHIIQAGNFGGWKSALHWGIDLAGGTNLIYQVDTKPAAEKNITISEAMDQMVGTIIKRINPSGTEEVSVRKVGIDRIEIIIPGADQGVVQTKKDAMLRLGSLEFGIVANEKDHRSLIAAAQAQPKTQDPVLDGSQTVAVWREVSEKGDSMPSSSVRTVLRKDKSGKEVPVQQVLIIKDGDEDLVTGDYLRRASPGLSEDGSACVNFSFDSEGAMRFFRLTSRNKPASDGTKRQLAIILDGKVHSAPNINSAISSNGQITGNFPPDELKALVDVLNAGALQLPIDTTPISEFSISPLLGEDVQRKGIAALLWSSLAVFLFMAVYYRFCGVVADVSLLLNLVLTVGVMVICNATFTLPGLAGMVLGLGMSVDANVLIYERMREEVERGSSLRMEIQNGFSKAFSAIWDSNVTTLIAAVVLYMIGTDQIKGFAVTLFIGICMSNFSALYFGHLVFDIAERKRWVTKLNMMKLIGVPNFDFIGKLKTAVTSSLSFIAIGLVMLVARGSDCLDIDFSGGSSVTFQFVKDQQIDDIRGRLQKSFDSMSLERLATSGESASGERGVQFRLRTKEQDADDIRKRITKTFSDPNYELKRIQMKSTLPSKTGGSQTSSRAPLDQRVLGAAGQDELQSEGSAKKEAKPDESKKDAESEAKSVEKSAEKSDPKSGDKPAEADKPAESEDKKPEVPASTKSGGDSPKTGGKSAGEIDSSVLSDPFADPLRTELSFKSEISTSTAADHSGISTSTAADYLLVELRKINKAFDEANAPALFRIKGTEGPGLTAPEGKAKKFTKMELEVSSTVSAEELSQALEAMQKTLEKNPIFEEVSNFASSVADDMRYYAILALLASGAATIIYLWFRFTKADFGIAAVVAVFHDVFFTLACLPMAYHLSRTPLGPLLGLEDFKLNLSIVAALLTIVGYSLNDTIVIFDRVRELRGRNPQLTLQMVNDSVNQTLSRTLLTAFIVFITVVILYAMGGEGIHGFAFCMLIGTLVGCYSTIYIASPLLLWLWNREQKHHAASRP
jgi:SecD/SecF fusion protein